MGIEFIRKSFRKKDRIRRILETRGGHAGSVHIFSAMERCTAYYYATDLVFKRQQTLQAFYPYLLETLIQAVKPADVATFLG